MAIAFRPTVVLLATYNGERFLARQLDSIRQQTVATWNVLASDDGSRDGTSEILEAHAQRWGTSKIRILQGPRRGFAQNFLSLVELADDKYETFAYCDQDDIWEPDKLQRALEWLTKQPIERPALYCSRTILVDPEERPFAASPLFTKAPSFANALVQNIGSGNTMVFNKAARDLLREAGQDVPVISHDWWTYIVVSGCGGNIMYDATPTVLYRQHGSNLIGMNIGLKARFHGLRRLLRGEFREWTEGNLRALDRLRHRLTPDAVRTLVRFRDAREAYFPKRLYTLRSSGVYRQTLSGSLALYAAAAFKKI
jgi:glycosyltransferase involved in cell wall biosynthesis